MPSSIARAARAVRRSHSSQPSTPRPRNTTAAPAPPSTGPQAPAVAVTPPTAPATGTRADVLRGMPTFTAAATAQTGLVPVRLNEVNLRITPIRITPTAAEPWRTGLSAAFFDEAATGAGADQATTILRAGLQALVVQNNTGVPLQAYFPSGPSALTKEIDGRTRKHTGTYVLRVAKAYARNLINLASPYAAVTGDDVGNVRCHSSERCKNKRKLFGSKSVRSP